MSKDSATGLGIGLLVGMVAGIAAGLLYAPRPGSETRGQIRERATDLGEKARDRFNRIRGKTNESEETA